MKSLRDRVLAQPWARSTITFPFAGVDDHEPIGYRDTDGAVLDHAAPGLLPQHLHRGTDFGLWTGTPVTVALTGMVTYAAWSPLGYGGLVTIEGTRYKSRYAHLSKIEAIVGTLIWKGFLLGYSGATGNVTGPHLHYEVYDKQRDAYVDPLKFIEEAV